MLKHFNYWLIDYGWAEAFFTSNQQSIRFEFSYLSDPLAELIRSLLKLLNKSEGELIIDFYNEPGLYRLTLTMINDTDVRMEIRMSPDTEGVEDPPENWNETKLIFALTDTLHNVCDVVYAGVLDLSKRHSDTEYLEEWINYPFPTDEFKLLGQEVAQSK